MSITAPAAKPRDLVLDVYGKGVERGALFKDLFKAFYTIIALAENFFGYKPSDQVKRAANMAKTTKNLLDVPFIPLFLYQFYQRFIEIFTPNAPSDKRTQAAKVTDAFFAANKNVSPIVDAMEELVKADVIPLSQRNMQIAKNINSGALVLGQGRCAIQSGTKLFTGKETVGGKERNLVSEQKWESLLEFAKNISFVALGIIGLIGAVIALTYGSQMGLIAASSALFFSIVGTLYKGIVEPEKKAALAATTASGIPSKKAYALLRNAAAVAAGFPLKKI